MADIEDTGAGAETPPAAAGATGAAGSVGDDPDAEVVAALQKDPAGIRKLLEKKRGWNTELETHRKTAEGYKTQLEELTTARQKEIEDAENAKLTETEKLNKELGKHQTLAQQLQTQIGVKDDEITSLRVQNAALKLGASNPKYIEFEYREHLKTLSEDARKAFGAEDMAKWVVDFKEKNAGSFGITDPAPGQTRPTPPGGRPLPERTAETNVDEKLKNPKTPQDQAALNRSINNIINSH